jgi:DNA-directed RNA polymerase subunit RPC12/RpoP
MNAQLWAERSCGQAEVFQAGVCMSRRSTRSVIPVAGAIPAALATETLRPAVALWLPVLGGVVLLAALAALLANGGVLLRGRPQRPLTCPECGSKRHAVNPTTRVYRCLDCGQRGELPKGYQEAVKQRRS